MDAVIALLAYFAVISVAAERVVQILKGIGVMDRINRSGAANQAVAGITGAAIAYLSPPDLVLLQFDPRILPVVVGLATSGGAAVWNDLLATLALYRRRLESPRKEN